MKKTKMIEQKILDKMKERGYRLTSQLKDGTKANFINDDKNIMAIVCIDGKFVNVQLLVIYNDLIVIKTLSFDFYHPRFTSLFEKELIHAIYCVISGESKK